MRNFSVTALLLCACLPALAGDGLRDFDFRVGLDPRLTSSNVAAIGALDSAAHYSVARAYALAEQGQLMSIEASPSSLEAGAVTESYTRISERLAFHGMLRYSYFHGKDMGGQILSDPSYNPVNFIESVDTTTGVRTSDTYRLNGGIIYTFSPGWSVGVEADYTAGDRAKRRDPRFLNTNMDLRLSAGVYHSPSPRLSLGLALKYRNTSEGVTGKVYGEAGKSYYVLADKGGFWGTKQMLDGDYNYIPTSSTFHMLNNFYGGSLQADWKGEGFSICNDLTLLRRTGDYGKHSSSTPIFFEFGGIVLDYSVTVLMPARGDNLHRIRLDAGYRTLGNSENVFAYETPAGGSTVVVYKGQNKLSDRTDLTGGIEYRFFRDVTGYRPRAEYAAYANFSHLSRHTQAFPYYRDNSTSCIDAGLDGRWSIFKGRNVFSPAAGVVFHTGFGNPGTTGCSMQAQTSMTSFDSWLRKQFEYDTAMRAGACLGFTYTRIVKSDVSVDVCIRDTFQYLTSAPQYLGGRSRNSALLSVICNF